MSSLPTCYRHPDRETGLSCSECGRPICVECVTYAPVGLRCPDHSGKAHGAAKVKAAMGRSGDDLVTRILIGANVLVFLGEGRNRRRAAELGRLDAVPALGRLRALVAAGEWWRLVTSGFVHDGIFHIAVNMYSALDPRRFAGAADGRGLATCCSTSRRLLAGSAGAVVLSSCIPTIGASGAIFGLLGAALVLRASR